LEGEKFMMKGSTVTLQDDEQPQKKTSKAKVGGKQVSVKQNDSADDALNSKLQSVKDMERNLKRESERMRREYEAQLQGLLIVL
jgi:ribosome-associated translation inhibitor RaiA